MQMHLWDERMIRSMRAAAEYGDYNKILAERILRHLRPDAYAVDAGCGLGHLALELAKKLRSVTALDLNENALRVLEENKALVHAENLEICRCALEDFTADEAPDAMIFCLFGTAEEMIEAAERSHCPKIIAVYRRENDELWHDRVSFPGDASGAWRAVSKEPMDIPLDQPFCSFEEAREFVDMYPLSKDGATTDAELTEKLMPADHGGYTYRLPVTRRLEMLVLEKN